MEPVGVVSNHPRVTYARIDFGDIPFHHLPVSAATKAAQARRIRDIIDETSADLVVLARYMQIQSDVMSAFLASRCINIPTCFLPGFKGAKPSHPALSTVGKNILSTTTHVIYTFGIRMTHQQDGA